MFFYDGIGMVSENGGEHISINRKVFCIDKL
jgi:hypothetical protein